MDAFAVWLLEPWSRFSLRVVAQVSVCGHSGCTTREMLDAAETDPGSESQPAHTSTFLLCWLNYVELMAHINCTVDFLNAESQGFLQLVYIGHPCWSQGPCRCSGLHRTGQSRVWNHGVNSSPDQDCPSGYKLIPTRSEYLWISKPNGSYSFSIAFHEPERIEK